MEILGRTVEKKTFEYCLKAKESKLIAVYGRRRIGKTFLIQNYFNSKITFEIAGLHKGQLADQLEHFTTTLIEHGYLPASTAPLKTWMNAFRQLKYFIDSKKGTSKKVIFIDELPWFDTPRSKFLMAFENFWNSYCAKRKDLIVIICGSAASWMIKKILNNKGGLHNRIAEKMILKSFTLDETEQFLKSKRIKWSRMDIAQLYMCVGGVPFYLNAIRTGESIHQFINRVCFKNNGLLINEYEELFSSLFNASEQHKQIIETLSKTKKGLARNDLVKKTKLKTGGTLTNILGELIASGFVEKFLPFRANRTKSYYRLIDPFSLFYLKFMDGSGNSTLNWQRIAKSPSWNSWAGFAFERLCFNHIEQIKFALGISVIDVDFSNWEEKTRGETSQSGAQIDLLIDRADKVVNICEIKFSPGNYIINKDYAMKLRNKVDRFANVKGNEKKTLFLTMITTNGISQNEYSNELVQSEVVLDDLFKPSMLL